MSQIIDEVYKDFIEKYNVTYVLMQTFIFIVCSSLFFYKVKEFVFSGDYIYFADKASVFSIYFILYISSFLTRELLTRRYNKYMPIDMT